MSKVIQVGAVVIISHDNYWKVLEQISKHEDMISSGLGKVGVKTDTPFSRGVKSRGGTDISHDDFKYLEELIEAARLYEVEYPVKFKFVYGLDKKPISIVEKI